jgi:2'-5' RNA ligase
MPSIRSFVAIELSPDTKAQIVKIQNELKASTADIRWVRTEGMHLTLKFLGGIQEEKIPEIADILTHCSDETGSFNLTIHSLGAFPNGTNPKVIWIGVEDESGRLETLQQTIEKGLAAIGFKEEKRAFTPHLTLGRLKSPKGRREVGHLIEASRECDCGTSVVKEICLFKSDLKPSGAVYTKLKTFSLSE